MGAKCTCDDTCSLGWGVGKAVISVFNTPALKLILPAVKTVLLSGGNVAIYAQKKRESVVGDEYAKV